MRKENGRITIEEHNQIIELYRSGETNKNIRDIVGISDMAIYDHVKLAKKWGELPNDFVKPKKEKEKKPPVPKKAKKEIKEEVFEQPPGTVRCSAKVSKTCIYGYKNQRYDGPKCNYILCTGKMRGCPGYACDKYEKITKDNKRRQEHGFNQNVLCEDVSILERA